MQACESATRCGTEPGTEKIGILKGDERSLNVCFMWGIDMHTLLGKEMKASGRSSELSEYL